MTRVMSSNPTEDESAVRTAAQFATTHWSVVLAAGDSASPESREALEQLCRGYWYPLYSYVRRHGFGPEDAQDITQEFFAIFLEKGYLERADPGRGRFRTFLLSSMQNFLHNVRDRSSRRKRGGEYQFVSWDTAAFEERYRTELVESLTPEKVFEKQWAAALLQQAIDRLRADFQLTGKLELFEALKGHLWAEDDAVPYARLAETLGMTPVALKLTVHRLRQRFRERLLEVIRHTVSSPEEVEEEIQYLLRVFSE